MAQELQVKGALPVAMGPPPAYKETNKTKLYVIAVTVTVVTLLVLSFGVFYLVFSAQTPTVVNNLATEDDDQVIIIRDVAFEMFDGVPRNEKMMAQGNTLIIQNVNDGYTATFDYDKNIVMIKNLTTNSCYFTPLDSIPGNMNVENLDNILPFFFRATNLTAGVQLLNHPNARIFANRLEPIPAGYVKLTDTDQCIDSFWIEPKNTEATRNVRQAVTVEFFKCWSNVISLGYGTYQPGSIVLQSLNSVQFMFRSTKKKKISIVETRDD
ncbi:hypothetical protein BSL78_18415 [Apostichopus japonicus]|uniref:BRICHOS domain-containing protein n=1 Tax=Stichopus japonicus TaxID=307972 RepID=A0A2G8K9U8_STIJA|nr:hypothetical protein BSL78_18415 [Apostichopus japonicus]